MKLAQAFFISIVLLAALVISGCTQPTQQQGMVTGTANPAGEPGLVPDNGSAAHENITANDSTSPENLTENNSIAPEDAGSAPELPAGGLSNAEPPKGFVARIWHGDGTTSLDCTGMTVADCYFNGMDSENGGCDACCQMFQQCSTITEIAGEGTGCYCEGKVKT
jgi:hypothetical protein